MFVCIVLVLLSCMPSGGGQATVDMLNDFARDFREDPASRADSLSFGVKVHGEGVWHISIDGAGAVTVSPGMPPEPTFLYVTDRETLRKVHRGELAALTAMARARASDPAPLELEFIKGCAPDASLISRIVPFTFHFWTRGLPEIVVFGEESHTRSAHGAQATVLYYQKGLRSAWYQVKRGQHINAEEADQTNPFPTLMIFTKGEAEARIGGRHVRLRAGQCVLVPEGVSHELWNSNDEPAEFIIVMFGEGA